MSVFNFDYDEKLLDDNNDQISNECVYEYEDLWEAYNRADSAFWRITDVDLTNDTAEDLSEDEKNCLFLVLAFFAIADKLVNDNLIERFVSEIKVVAASNFFFVQMHMETTHNVCYHALLNTYVKNRKRLQELKQSVKTIPVIQKKAEWMKKWTQSDYGFPLRLIAFACAEGILFSGAFYIIFWLKTRSSKMHGLIELNKLISKDEWSHRQFACLLMKHIKHRPPQHLVHQVIAEAVELELEFMDECIPESGLMGLNREVMKEFNYFIANQLLIDLEYDPLFEVTCTYKDFPFIDQINFSSKANFFERKVVDYARSVHSSATMQHLGEEERKKMDEMHELSFDFDI